MPLLDQRSECQPVFCVFEQRLIVEVGAGDLPLHHQIRVPPVRAVDDLAAAIVYRLLCGNIVR
jgi:hypothetical protein